ncbi:MAG: NlpC/P60 family protein [Bacteroidia bacterium]
MSLKIKLSFIFLLCCFCKLYAQQANADSLKQYELCYYSQCFGFPVTAINNDRLFDCIDLWTGTKYKLAGSDLDGIDCSRFAMMVYNYAYGKTIDGTADELYKKCRHIDKDELEQGNLVFFKTSKRRISHVGVYLGDNKFAHSSSSNGIIISDLDEPYYKKYFAGGGVVEN